MSKDLKDLQDNGQLLVRNIGKSYNGRTILRDVSLQLSCGEVVGLFGPNGAGKTSCFSIIAGILEPDYGEVFIDGINVTDLPMYLRAKVGMYYLPQENSVFRGLTVEKNILAVLQISKKSKYEYESILVNLLSEFSISHLRYVLAINLSGGERRRLEMARILASFPQYVLLDEPLAGVDPISVLEISELIYKLKEKNIGLLITDHNIRETLNLVDRSYIMHEGLILKEGKLEDIISDDIVRKVYLGNNFNI